MSDSKVNHKEKIAEEKRKNMEKILTIYIKLVKSGKKFPTRADLAELGVNRDAIRHYFTNILKLRDMAKLQSPEYFRGVVSPENYDNSMIERKKKKTYFITTIVNGQELDRSFLGSIETYLKKNNAQLLLLPSHDPAHNLDNEIEWHFDEEVINKKYPIIFEQFTVNSNLHISGIRVTAKQINPTTGLARLSQGHGSFIFASPKQSLEFVPNSNIKLPHAMMSTGACTLPNYNTTKGNSLRTAFLAEYDHVMGGVIVEVKDDVIYHFRQVQADKDGRFIDLGIEYSPKGTKRVKNSSLIMGDYHAGEHDETAVKANEHLAKRVGVERVFLHDMFNGMSINHHEMESVILRAQRASSNQLSLEEELKITSQEIDRVAGWKGIKKVVMVKSNHDEFLIRWLNHGKLRNDPLNYKLGCKLSDLAIENTDPLQAGIDVVRPLKYKAKIKWLNRDEDYRIADIECGAHGDKGPNGSRGSKASIEKAYGKAIIGHSHTPGILRGIYQVGTSSKLQLGYNIGPSSWVHCSCIVYPNGQRQLINFINGQYTLLK